MVVRWLASAQRPDSPALWQKRGHKGLVGMAAAAVGQASSGQQRFCCPFDYLSISHSVPNLYMTDIIHPILNRMGDDDLQGGGDDRLMDGPGADTLNDGPGMDIASSSELPGGVRVNLATASPARSMRAGCPRGRPGGRLADEHRDGAAHGRSACPW